MSMGEIEKETDVLLLSVGSRVSLNGNLGTVKYCGQVKDKDGLWYGVDWDDPKRGRHNGTFGGVNYFTANHPNSGSFVHPTKVDIGQSLAEAIEERYVHCYESLTDEDRCLQQQSRDRLIEFVGAEKVALKVSRIRELQVANVHKSRVSSAGNLFSLVPALKELNLSMNLISDWRTVSEILDQLPHLVTLDISENHLKPLSLDLSCYPELSTLILNNMDITWKEVRTLATFLSRIQNLKLVSNHICDLDTPPGMLQNLAALDLSNNELGSWEEVLKLGHLPKLSRLNLASNGLLHVFLPDNQNIFLSLQNLNLSKNKICSWTDVAELSKLKKLEKLKMALNTVMKLDTAANTRQLIIAKIPTLKFLEGIEITKFERKGSEWDYIMKYWNDWKNAESNSKFTAEHPTYESLIERHGPPESSDRVNVTNEKINVLSLTIYSPLLPDKPPISRKIPEKIVIGKLKQMIKKWLQINESNVILSYKTSQQDVSTEYSIEDDTQVLSFYALSNGDILCVRW